MIPTFEGQRARILCLLICFFAPSTLKAQVGQPIEEIERSQRITGYPAERLGISL